MVINIWLHHPDIRPHIYIYPYISNKSAYDGVSLLLVQVSVHGRHGEVLRLHLLRQPVDLAPRVAVDDGLVG